MAMAIHQISPVAHLPLGLGVVRKLNVAGLIDTFCPPHPAHGLSCGRGVEALLLAILDESREMLGIMDQLRYNGLASFTCHSNPEKLPYACQTSTRHVQR